MIRRALLFSLGQRYLAVVLQLATSMVMARLLTPTEAGIFSLAAVAVSIGQVIRDFGVGDYLVKEQVITPEKVRAAFTVTTLFAWATAAVFVVLAPLLAAAYDEPRLATVLHILSLNFLLIPFGSTATALLFRQLRFGTVFWVQTTSLAIGSATTVGLALAGFSYLSPAYGALASVAATVLMLFVLSRTNVLVRPTLHGLRGVFRFGGTLTLARLVEELSEKSPDFIVTAVLGFHAGGVWGKAGTLLTAFQDFVTTGVSKVATPVLARLDSGSGPSHGIPPGTDTLWPAFERAAQMLFLLQCSFFAWLLVCAPEVVGVLFGPQWVQAVVLVQAGAVGGILWAPCALANALLTARGHAREQLQVNVVYGAVLASAVAVGASISLGVAAVLLQGAVLLRTGLTLRALRRRLGFGTRRLLRALAPSAGVALAAGVLSAAAVWGCRQAGAPALVTLLCGAGVVGAAALGAAIATGHPVGQEVRRALTGRLRRTGGGA